MTESDEKVSLKVDIKKLLRRLSEIARDQLKVSFSAGMGAHLVTKNIKGKSWVPWEFSHIRVHSFYIQSW